MDIHAGDIHFAIDNSIPAVAEWDVASMGKTLQGDLRIDKRWWRITDINIPRMLEMVKINHPH